MKKVFVIGLLVCLLCSTFVFAADPAQQPTVTADLPQITLDAGPIILTRVQSTRPLLSSSANPGSGDVLKSSDIDGKWSVGGQAHLTLGYPSFYMDFGGFLIPTDSKNLTKALPAGTIFEETTPRSVYGTPAGSIGVFRYRSSIVNLELNIGHKYTPWLSAYAGIRYIKISEQFDFVGLFPGGFSEDDNWKAKNSMVGPQIGVKGDLLKAAGSAGSPLSLDTNIAVALLRNEASTNFSFTTNTGAVLAAGSATKDSWSPAVAAEVDLGYALSRNIKVAVGYQALYLNSVALAPNQLRPESQFAGAATTTHVDKTSALYHGAVAKLVISLP